ncbi:MAG: 3-deoxy-manno-octulosonate cytidylyltransferase, partial [Chthoniobacterales bacterium]|nr:3-deoxy-manno-octulosonate cytidylyltransferase [Chthoniobacterales bacterium]
VETAVKQFGGEAIMTSSQHRCGTERLAEVAAKLPAKLYVNLQGDEPLARVEDISLLIKSMEAEGQADAGTLCHAITLEEAADPNVVKVVFDHQGFALYFSRSRIPYERDGNGAAVSYWKHVGIYAFRPPALQIYNPNQNQPEMEQLEKLEQLRMLWHGLKIRVWQTTASAQGVDTPDQLNQVRQILAERIRNGI